MRCPLCNTTLANGWWCNDCKSTTNKLEWAACLKRNIQPDYSGYVLVGIGILAAITIVAHQYLGR
jgi:hypothetical protein